MKRQLFEYKKGTDNFYPGAFFIDAITGWYYQSKNIICILVAGNAHKISAEDFTQLSVFMNYEVVSRGR